MPRWIDYWTRRKKGLCVECPNATTKSRCFRCRARRYELRRDRAGRVTESADQKRHEYIRTEREQ